MTSIYLYKWMNFVVVNAHKTHPFTLGVSYSTKQWSVTFVIKYDAVVAVDNTESENELEDNPIKEKGEEIHHTCLHMK